MNGYKVGSELKIKIIFNGVYIPGDNDVDRRERSGLVDKIIFE